jgi:hypothetical protein
VSYCQHCDADFTKFELETLDRAERAEERVKELEEDLKGEAMELQAKKILLNNAGLTISKYQSKLSDVTLEWIAATERVKELEDIVHGIGKLLEENGHTVTFTLKANRLITKCHELFRTENK